MLKGFRLTLIGACILANIVLAADVQLLPPWLQRAIERRAPYPYAIWEVTLDGKPAYNFVVGTEKNDLFSKEGEWLCRWGGYSGSVISGSCPGEMAFVRAIFPYTPRQSDRSPDSRWSLY